MSKRVWLITGCSSGFGRELVKIVASQDEIVVGTVRQEKQIESLEAINPELVKGVILDVQNQDSIDKVAQFIKDTYGKLDVLVNNAGYGSMGSIEETAEDEIQRQFDVNVFGCVRLMKLALPFMRAQRSGNILNITSIAGLAGFPGVGIYNGSKFALEGIGEALAAETSHIGIKVTNVEPGPFRTDWAGRSATFNESQIDEYKETAKKNMESIQGISGSQVGDPVRAAQAMYDLTKLENPPVHLPLGDAAHQRLAFKLENLQKEVSEFESLGRPTDYTEAELQALD